MLATNLHLLARFPRLRDTMPVVPLGAYPTPVERLGGVENAARLPATTQLWVKRDDLSGEPWGMSKVRKLEHYFGDARAAGARRVLTFGPLGSNHALATALYGKQLGFEVHLQLWPEPATERVRQTLLAEQSLGAKLFLVGTLDERALVELAGDARCMANTSCSEPGSRSRPGPSPLPSPRPTGRGKGSPLPQTPATPSESHSSEQVMGQSKVGRDSVEPPPFQCRLDGVSPHPLLADPLRERNISLSSSDGERVGVRGGSDSGTGAEFVYVIPPAGTDPVGAMGYVEAGLELGAQVARGELPAPDFIHVAGGTGGVAAGLVIGLRLAGLRSRVVAIRCVAAEVLTELRIVFLARRLRQRLAQLAGVEESSLPQPVAEDFLILHDQAGGGYGRPTEASERARALFEASASLVLDGTYTAKAAAGLLAFAAADGAGRRHLFFHTYAHRDLGGLAAGASWRELPPPFHPYFDSSAS
jgi:1-aminocyclopropane-1-carboxylate deaminase/D-cysteine desulfhydrase-like pyridoxal-dependent ACC family enzyme